MLTEEVHEGNYRKSALNEVLVCIDKSPDKQIWRFVQQFQAKGAKALQRHKTKEGDPCSDTIEREMIRKASSVQGFTCLWSVITLSTSHVWFIILPAGYLGYYAYIPHDIFIDLTSMTLIVIPNNTIYCEVVITNTYFFLYIVISPCIWKQTMAESSSELEEGKGGRGWYPQSQTSSIPVLYVVITILICFKTQMFVMLACSRWSCTYRNAWLKIIQDCSKWIVTLTQCCLLSLLSNIYSGFLSQL